VGPSRTPPPIPPALAGGPEQEWQRGLPGPRRTRRRLALGLAAFVLVAAGSVALLARIGQLEAVARRLEHASIRLVALAVVFEALSFAGYVALTRILFAPASPRISWSASLQITLAGVVATRIVTAGGAGGIALTTWALRAAGLDTRRAAARLAAFLVVLYSVYFGALVVAGVGLATRVLGGPAPTGLALAGAAVGALTLGLGLATLLMPRDLERRARRVAERDGRLAQFASQLAPLPAVAREAVVLALQIARQRPGALAAALAWWGFDVAVLWSTFEMFGAPPAISVLVLCYFLGQVAQVIPVPGGVGPVEGGMIASFVACGVPVALALVSVLAYKTISTWLPAAPGTLAYLKLRRAVAAWRAGG
jgi:uncharacterized membrane protein YbhN (UPF0104 family)